jgi:hypothetical protein
MPRGRFTSWARGVGVIGRLSKILVGSTIPYNSIPCGRPTLDNPSQPNGRLAVGCSQIKFNLLVTEILNLPCVRVTPDWPLDRSRVGHPQIVEPRVMVVPRDTLHKGVHGDPGHPGSYAPVLVSIAFVS